MGVLMKDIAEKLGISKTTVWRAVNNNGRISKETHKKVLKLVKELDYQPQFVLGKLRLERTKTIGCIVTGEIYDPFVDAFYGKVLRSIETEASLKGYHLLFSTFTEENFNGALPSAVEKKQVRGLIVAGKIDKNFLFLLEDELPVVLVDYYIEGKEFDCVVNDNTDGAYKAVKYLIDLGHRRIGFINSTLESPSSKERLSGYKKALKEIGLNYSGKLVKESGSLVEGGYRAMEKMLKLSKVPTAVFAFNDTNALGAMKAIKENGLKIPDDISIVGFDDFDFAAHTEPPLTTVRDNKREMGKRAVRRLLEKIDDYDEKPQKIVLPVDLIIRKTCKALNQRES